MAQNPYRWTPEGDQRVAFRSEDGGAQFRWQPEKDDVRFKRPEELARLRMRAANGFNRRNQYYQQATRVHDQGIGETNRAVAAYGGNPGGGGGGAATDRAGIMAQAKLQQTGDRLEDAGLNFNRGMAVTGSMMAQRNLQNAIRQQEYNKWIQARAEKAQTANKILGGIVGTAGTVIGGAIGGPGGAALGGKLGEFAKVGDPDPYVGGSTPDMDLSGFLYNPKMPDPYKPVNRGQGQDPYAMYRQPDQMTPEEEARLWELYQQMGASKDKIAQQQSGW